MIVRKLGILLILLAIIEISTSCVTSKTSNNTIENVNSLDKRDTRYPQHTVQYHLRGLLEPIVETCIHWLDYQQKDSGQTCPGRYNGQETSPNWAIGYFITTGTEDIDMRSDNVLWWSGWVGQKYCNDMHIHVKGIAPKLSFAYNTIDESAICKFPDGCCPD